MPSTSPARQPASSLPQNVREELEESLGSVPVSLSPSARFEEYLQARGQRNTEQRKYLIESVFRYHDHFDADQLIERLPRKGAENYVSRPTVYRTLKEFVDAGLLRSFELNGRSVYEHDYGYPQHDHFYCGKCHKLIEFRSDEITKLLEEISNEYKFRARSHKLTVQGVCDDCSKARTRERRHQDRV